MPHIKKYRDYHVKIQFKGEKFPLKVSHLLHFSVDIYTSIAEPDLISPGSYFKESSAQIAYLESDK